MFVSEWREFPSVPCLSGGKKNLTARVSMLLARVPDLLSSLFLSWSGKGLISTPVYADLTLCFGLVID